jgi:hypothetical protein
MADGLGMRSPIAFIAAVLAALLCAVPALAPAVTPTVPLRTDGRLPIGFNEDYSQAVAAPLGSRDLRHDPAMPRHDVDVVVIHTLVQSPGSLNYGPGQPVADSTGAPQFLPTPGYLALQAKFGNGR